MNTPPHLCEVMRTVLLEDETPVVYNPKFREYDIELEDSEVRQGIYFCPWCGAALPGSLRNEWFEMLDELGLEPEDESEIPIQMKSDRWWVEKGL